MCPTRSKVTGQDEYGRAVVMYSGGVRRVQARQDSGGPPTRQPASRAVSKRSIWLDDAVATARPRAISYFSKHKVFVVFSYRRSAPGFARFLLCSATFRVAHTGAILALGGGDRPAHLRPVPLLGRLYLVTIAWRNSDWDSCASRCRERSFSGQTRLKLSWSPPPDLACGDCLAGAQSPAFRPQSCASSISPPQTSSIRISYSQPIFCGDTIIIITLVCFVDTARCHTATPTPNLLLISTRNFYGNGAHFTKRPSAALPSTDL